ncbi:PREDICTED: uncharacterized protein LOC106107845 [Papilio polytes]|uniref:uncharacterized protein LOC106107845 n=1 Tax=Papilio polytes TaxID=76194 RepID=UPI000676400C|nr:PREDICTED: uncharacterized protein LOC106107845 [Papilio polytes]
MYVLIISIVIAFVNAKPTEDIKQEQMTDVKETLSSYIEKFKTTISENVEKEYINLSQQEKQEVNNNLDEFIIKFSEDLIEVLSKKEKLDTKEKVNNLPELDEAIKITVLREFPDIDDITADEIVYRLKKNIINTRRKLKSIVNKTKKDN